MDTEVVQCQGWFNIIVFSSTLHGKGVNYKFWGKNSEVHLIITKGWPKIKPPNFKKS